jgi:P-type Ca2+ transporter type 2B
MQLFNQINARKIELGELNVFHGFFNNFLFLGVTIFTFAVQMFMVENGGKAVKCAPLTTEQNYVCLVFGGLELLWGLIIKFMPLKLFQCISLDEKPLAEGHQSLSASLKKSSVLKKKQSEKMILDMKQVMKERVAQQMQKNALSIN